MEGEVIPPRRLKTAAEWEEAARLAALEGSFSTVEVPVKVATGLGEVGIDGTNAE